LHQSVIYILLGRRGRPEKEKELKAIKREINNVHKSRQSGPAISDVP
jgi:hypothetical protein